MAPLTSDVGRGRVPAAALALGLPGLIVSLIILAFALASAAGLTPTARDYQLTLAEAAALHDLAEIVRLVRAGRDPRQPAPVREGIIGEQPAVLTPMAAAILERRVDVIALLADVGGRIRPEEAAEYWCLAQVRGDAAVVAAVEAQAPRSAAVDCSTAVAPPDERN